MTKHKDTEKYLEELKQCNSKFATLWDEKEQYRRELAETRIENTKLQQEIIQLKEYNNNLLRDNLKWNRIYEAQEGVK